MSASILSIYDGARIPLLPTLDMRFQSKVHTDNMRPLQQRVAVNFGGKHHGIIIGRSYLKRAYDIRIGDTVLLNVSEDSIYDT